jgi:hypothetical protein
MSETVRPFRAIYLIPHFSPVVIEDEASMRHVKGTLRMVLEDDVWNAAARGEDLGKVPPMRMVKPLGALERGGVRMPRSRGMSDDELHHHLWTVVEALALLGVYLLNTDGLTDRELYDGLRDHYLRQPAILVPAALGYAYCIDAMAPGPMVVRREPHLPRPRGTKGSVLQPAM